jgi:ubiquinone/menaquinone biosynthesis C-methylase UbiE
MHPKELLEAFKRGENITEILRKKNQSEANTLEIIETAYDLQTGSYVSDLEDSEVRELHKNYGDAIASEISALTKPQSILEPGVGEGTTLSFVSQAFEQFPAHIHGIDISWSRIACCRNWLKSEKVESALLSIASLFNVPYAENSFDVVYTSHTIEPNGGNERPILEELYRIASRYLILVEPGYELASKEAQERMLRHGYCTSLVEHAEALGMKVIKHELLSFSDNLLNPSAITIIEKNPAAASVVPQFVCPRYSTPLKEFPDSLYSPESLRAYPKIQGIPCLRTEDGVVASAYDKYRID